MVCPSFQNHACCEKYLKDNKHSSHLPRKYAQIFVPGHYLFLIAHSFPRATLSEKITSKDKYSSIFPGQMEAIVYILIDLICLWSIYIVRRSVDVSILQWYFNTSPILNRENVDYPQPKRGCDITHLQKIQKNLHLNSRTEFTTLAMLERMRLTCYVLPQGKALNVRG